MTTSGSLQPQHRRADHPVDVRHQKMPESRDLQVDLCLQWDQESIFGPSDKGLKSSTEWGMSQVADVVSICKENPLHRRP